jgi:hypothetical protein
MPFEPFGDSAVVALAAVWARNSEPVRATPVEAAISCIKVRRVSMGDSMVGRAPRLPDPPRCNEMTVTPTAG